MRFDEALEIKVISIYILLLNMELHSRDGRRYINIRCYYILLRVHKKDDIYFEEWSFYLCNYKIKMYYYQNII